MNELIAAAATLLKTLVLSGHVPTHEEIEHIARSVATSELAVARMADEFDRMHKALKAVTAAFEAKPGEVPILDIDVEMTKPSEDG